MGSRTSLLLFISLITVLGAVTGRHGLCCSKTREYRDEWTLRIIDFHIVPGFDSHQSGPGAAVFTVLQLHLALRRRVGRRGAMFHCAKPRESTSEAVCQTAACQTSEASSSSEPPPGLSSSALRCG